MALSKRETAAYTLIALELLQMSIDIIGHVNSGEPLTEEEWERLQKIGDSANQKWESAGE